MIDEGQTDWKIIAIDNTDPMARKLSDISDIDVYMPGLIKTTLDWFRLYKVRLFFFYSSVHLTFLEIEISKENVLGLFCFLNCWIK